MANDAYEVKRGIIGKPKVAYQCAKCHNDLESDLTDAGKKDTCPLCKAAFIVPGQRELKEMQNAAKRKEEERRVAEAHRIRQREEKLRLEEDARTRREEERKKREDEAGAREAEEAAQRRKDREKGCLPPFAEEAAQRRKEASRNLVNCPDCGRQISRLAPNCPGCGRPMNQTGPADVQPITRLVSGCFIGALGLGLFWLGLFRGRNLARAGNEGFDLLSILFDFCGLFAMAIGFSAAIGAAIRALRQRK